VIAGSDPIIVPSMVHVMLQVMIAVTGKAAASASSSLVGSPADEDL
jgi:hypothetical protein